MKMTNIHEAKTHLSRYLKEVEQCGVILLCKRNQPIAEIRRIAPRRSRERAIGLVKGTFEVPAASFEVLPEETISEFFGEDS